MDTADDETWAPSKRRKLQRKAWRQFAAPFQSTGDHREAVKTRQEWQSRAQSLAAGVEAQKKRRQRASDWVAWYQELMGWWQKKAHRHDLTTSDKIREAFPYDRKDFRGTAATAARVPSSKDSTGDSEGLNRFLDQGVSGLKKSPSAMTVRLRPDGPASPWCWKIESHEKSEDLTFALKLDPSDEALARRSNLGPEELRERSLRWCRQFSGDSTFQEPIAKLRSLAGPVVRWRKELARNIERREIRLAILRKVLDHFDTHGNVPSELRSDHEPEHSNKQELETPVIEGYHAPDYAREALAVLNRHECVSDFSKLAGKIGEPTVSGSSKVDTLKRATGYNDLPREKKSFQRFKERLLSAEIA